MASVYLGWLSGPGDFSRVVAIKRMHPQLMLDQEFVTRFRDEAWLSARLLHPNIVQVLDIVEHRQEDLLIVMEYIHGISLRALWADARSVGERLPPGVIAGVLVPALMGLHAAHEATDDQGQPIGTVHRDFSPQNIMVSSEGHAKILDFGIAKARTHIHVTSTGLLSGKVGYFSPEQIEGRTLDRRTDVFAAGIVLWEMLTGERLFGRPGVDEPAAIYRILNHPVRPPSALNPAVPGRLDEIVLRALERSPDARFPTARDLAGELEIALDVASPSRLAEWVQRICGDRMSRLSRTLGEARRSMAQIQPTAALPLPAEASVAAVAAPGIATGSTAVTTNDVVRRRGRKRPLLTLAVVAVTAMAALGVAVRAGAWRFFFSHASPALGSPEAAASPTPVGARPIVSSGSLADPAPASLGSSAPESGEDGAPSRGAGPSFEPPASVAQSARASEPRSRSGRARPASSTHHGHGGGPGAGAAPDCDPPTYLDADGIRIFKEGCL